MSATSSPALLHVFRSICVFFSRHSGLDPESLTYFCRFQKEFAYLQQKSPTRERRPWFHQGGSCSSSGAFLLFISVPELGFCEKELILCPTELRTHCGRFLKDKTAISRDDKSSGIRGASDDVARRLILNTYKTLLTRGQKGCFVYCEDPALRDYLKRMIK